MSEEVAGSANPAERSARVLAYETTDSVERLMHLQQPRPLNGLRTVEFLVGPGMRSVAEERNKER
ncbi:hypothetical protein N7528_009627 [Penicillium herquei]|nr:hypothetical protein N7528_009627 [Penicillium herquei]KAJ5723289.1 hypothetical protein N7488_001324 [Penicillium malachiteum]